MTTRAFLVVCTFLSSVLFVNPAFAYSSPGDRDGFVNDFANMLAADTEETLNDRLTQAQEDTSSEVVVATIPTLGGETIENYTEKLFTEWNLERPLHTKGVMLLVARDEKQVRILAGSGLAGVLSEEKSDEIIQEVIIPAFKTDDFNDGIAQGAQAIVLTLQNSTSPATTSEKSSPWGVLYFVGGVIAILVLGKVLSKKKGGSGKSGGGSSLGGGSPSKTNAMTSGGGTTGATGKW